MRQCLVTVSEGPLQELFERAHAVRMYPFCVATPSIFWFFINSTVIFHSVLENPVFQNF